MIREAIGREESIYDESMAALRRSQLDKQSTLMEDSRPAGDAAAWKKTLSVRSETRPGNPAFLGQAMDVQRTIRDLKLRLAQLQGAEAASPRRRAGPAGGPERRGS